MGLIYTLFRMQEIRNIFVILEQLSLTRHMKEIRKRLEINTKLGHRALCCEEVL